MYFNIVQPLPCKTVMRLCRASFWPVLSIHSGSGNQFVYIQQGLCTLLSVDSVYIEVFEILQTFSVVCFFCLSGIMWFMVTFGIRFKQINFLV